MRSILYFTSVLFIGILAYSCSFNSVKGSGVHVAKDVTISDYKGVKFGGSGELIYEQKEGAPYLRIETDENIYPLLDIEVKDGILNIYSKENISPTKFRIITNSSSLEYLGVSGSMDATLKNKLETSHLDIDISGSGKIIADNLLCETFNAKVSGSGAFYVKGQAQKVDARISGSGKVEALDLVADTVLCSVSGSGNFLITANKSLKVSISGSGSVRYKGNPEIDQSISGSGSVSRY